MQPKGSKPEGKGNKELLEFLSIEECEPNIRTWNLKVITRGKTCPNSYNNSIIFEIRIISYGYDIKPEPHHLQLCLCIPFCYSQDLASLRFVKKEVGEGIEQGET